MVYQMDSTIIAEYLNVMTGKAMVAKGADFKGIMGLAERTSNDLFLPTGVYSLWSRDIPNPVNTGKLPSNNMYGTHPFYMARAQDNSWFGVFTNLANAQDWWLNNDATNGVVDITSMATGGIQDLYFMTSINPDSVVLQYHKIVGTPVLTPQWALGWNQCKWGYQDTAAVNNSVISYKENNLPLDTHWVDIDYLNNYQDFSYDPTHFADLPNLVDWLH